MDERRTATRTKQTPEERRLHHRTREDRRRKVYEQLVLRVLVGRDRRPQKLEVYERVAENLAAKLNIGG